MNGYRIALQGEVYEAVSAATRPDTGARLVTGQPLVTLVSALAVNTETSDEALVSSVHLPELKPSAFSSKHMLLPNHTQTRHEDFYLWI